MSDSFAILWTLARQAPLFIRYPRKEHWNGLPPGDLPNPGIKPTSPALTGGFFTTEPLGKKSKPWRWKDNLLPSIQYSHSLMSDSLQPHELQHTRLPCPSLSLGVCSNSCSLSWWWTLTTSSSATPFSTCPQSFTAQALFQWVSSSRQVAEVLELQLQHQSFQWILRADFL